MPGNLTFPPGFATIDANNVLTINQFLDSPTRVERALRTLVEQRFISDVLLAGRASPSGGSIMYEQNESIYADRQTLEAIQPGGEFPVTTVGLGPALISSVSKWGLDTPVHLEEVMRTRIMPVNRALTKLGNTVVKQVDSNALAAVQAAVTTTQAATAAWGTSGAKILLDILTAKASIYALNQGYDPDTLVISDLKSAQLMSDITVQTAMRRENPSNPVYTGQWATQLGGLDVLVTSNAPNTGEALVLDRKVLGGQADERPFTTGTRWWEPTETWWLRALRVTTPWVQEPASAVRITGI
jgi:hypothetical protein